MYFDGGRIELVGFDSCKNHNLYCGFCSVKRENASNK